MRLFGCTSAKSRRIPHGVERLACELPFRSSGVPFSQGAPPYRRRLNVVARCGSRFPVDPESFTTRACPRRQWGETVMPEEHHDLCWTCNHAPNCMNRGTADKPVFYCEEFDAYIPPSRISFHTPRLHASHLHTFTLHPSIGNRQRKPLRPRPWARPGGALGYSGCRRRYIRAAFFGLAG